MYQKLVFHLVAATLLLTATGSAIGQPGVDNWWSETIGGGATGNATVKAGAYTVTGNGADIWGATDQFHYLYRQLTGDGSITARVVSIGAGTNTWAKGGVMIRDNNSAGATQAMTVVTANSDGTAGNGACFQWRPTADSTSSSSSATATVAPPHWVRIKRIGNQFSSYLSPDGDAWTQMGTTQTIPMEDPVLIGLCVTSHASGELRTYTYDNVSYTGNVATRPPQVKAANPSPANGAVGVTTPLFMWTPGETAAFHKVYFGTTPELTEADLMVPQQTFAVYFYPLEFKAGQTYFWRIDEVDSDLVAHQGDVWSVTAATLAAYHPMPPSGALYQTVNPTLTWSPGQGALSHEIYFSLDKDAVANADASAFQVKQSLTSFEPAALAMDTTYYWKVDETDTAGKKHTGEVWSFTTTIPGLGAAKRELWNNISGTTVDLLTGDTRFPLAPDTVDEMPNFESPAGIGDTYGGKLSAWLHVPATGEYTFWIATDDYGQFSIGPDADTDVIVATVPGWSNAREWDKFPAQQSAPIHLEAGRYYIEALWKEGDGGDNCSAAWKGPSIPERTLISGEYLAPESYWAYGQQPMLGATDVPQVPELRWTAGKLAKLHDVYFGEDAEAVAGATPASTDIYRGQQALDQTTFYPGELEWNKTYFWRVDEINAVEAGSPWKGALWSFTAANFIVVDDMESYDDDIEAGTTIWQAWSDGMSNNLSGSVVGYMDALNGTFGERTIIHSGKQSMPMDYDNYKSPFYSEAEMEFSPVQNWTINDVNTLVLYARGYPPVGEVAVTETAGTFSVTGSGADIWGASDQFTYVFKTLDGDGAITARVVSIGPGTNTWAKGGVMIRDSLNGNATHAMTVLTANTDGTAGNGACVQYRGAAGSTSAGSNSASVIAAPYWVRMERTGDTLTGFISPDGNAWDPLGTTTILMTPPLHIGLCVTSHQAGEDRTYQFDSVSTTGNVSGAWQGAVISSARHNSAQPLYVVIEDSAGKKATATDATVVNAATWTPVTIPLDSLAGVNLSKVKRMYIGVGDRTNPVQDGSGRIFIDDIRVTRP